MPRPKAASAVRYQESPPDYRRTHLLSSVTFRSSSGPGAAPQLPPDLRSTVDGAATSAAVELFGAYRVTLAPVTGPDIKLPVPDLTALGIVRFTAPGLTGTAVLGASTRPLRR